MDDGRTVCELVNHLFSLEIGPGGEGRLGRSGGPWGSMGGLLASGQVEVICYIRALVKYPDLVHKVVPLSVGPWYAVASPPE